MCPSKANLGRPRDAKLKGLEIDSQLPKQNWELAFLKRTNVNLLKIAAGTAMCIFSLFSVFAGSTAWFLSVQNVDNSADSMKVKEAIRQFKSISIHRFVTSTTVSSTTTYYFDQAVASSATVDQIKDGAASIRFTMDKYTLLRQTNPTLALIELSDTFTASASEPVSLTLTTETATFLTSYTAEQVSEMTTRPLSNIVKATAGYLTSADSGDAASTLSDISNSGTMTYAIDGVTTSANQYVFTAPSESAYSKFVTFTDDTPSTPTTTLNLLNKTGGEKVKYMYIIFDYNSDALQSIYNHFLGQPFLEEDMSFQCDWTLTV